MWIKARIHTFNVQHLKHHILPVNHAYTHNFNILYLRSLLSAE